VYGRFFRLMLRLHRSSSVRDDTERIKGFCPSYCFFDPLHDAHIYFSHVSTNSLLSLLLVALALDGA